MSARGLLRTGLVLGARAAPGVSTTVPFGACLIVVVCYLVLRGR
ncbi:MAG: hypothetical protein V5A62_00615 [Haloarculaceae archaeon]